MLGMSYQWISYDTQEELYKLYLNNVLFIHKSLVSGDLGIWLGSGTNLFI